MDKQFAEELKALFEREGIVLESSEMYREGNYDGTHFVFIRRSDDAEVGAEDIATPFI